MKLDQAYERQSLQTFLADFLPGYTKDTREVASTSKLFDSATQLGSSTDLDLLVFEVTLSASIDKRIAITTDAFKLMKQYQAYRALIVFRNENDPQWRFSLMTSTATIEDGKIITKLSNPRRYSYLLGENTKTVTPYKYLVKNGSVVDYDDLQKRFSVEVVNKEFYNSIADLYTKLVGGKRKNGKKLVEYSGMLKISGKSSQSIEHQEFAVRLIGRLVFCWFLRQKKSDKGTSLIPESILSHAASRQSEYYHGVLAPLFFEVLNKKSKDRHDEYKNNDYDLVPYLNGGLFSPQEGPSGDHYQYNGGVPVSQMVEIPDVWLQEFTELLDRYNFTVDENTTYDVDLSVDPEMLGRIFENLLAEINPETGESARKSTGSFYTPRSIVEYMVDRSLAYSIKSKTNIEPDKIDALISYDRLDDSEHPLSPDEVKQVLVALSRLTVLDPACGSGAFPIGVLQKIVYVLQQLDTEARYWLDSQLSSATPELRRHLEEQYTNKNFDYLRKLGVIRESIYGVDIQPIAVEIAKLRCFLTLIVEEKVDDDLPNRGIEPLPNLDFKFVCANSLVQLPVHGAKSSSKQQQQIFEDTSHIDQLKDIRNKYFGATAMERLELQSKFNALQTEMALKNIDEYKGAASRLYNSLTRWKPFEHNMVDWFDAEWMFGIPDFDIVIANPPYLGEKGHKELFRKIREDGLKDYYMGKMDLFYFFFHLAINLNRDGGVTTFITTNYYPTASGAKKLRKDIFERTQIRELINFNELKIFESALGQHNMITVLEKCKDDQPTLITMAQSGGLAGADTLAQLLAKDSPIATYSANSKDDLFDEDDYSIRFSGDDTEGSSAADLVLSKIKNNQYALEHVASINQGLLSGADTVTKKHKEKFDLVSEAGDGIFVLDATRRTDAEVLESFTPKELQFVHPFYKNSNIYKYSCDTEPTKFVIYLSRTDGIDGLPNIAAHLHKFKALLTNRLTTYNESYPWYSLHRARERSIFESEKIMVPYRSKTNVFGYTNEPWYFRTDAYSVITKNSEYPLKYLLGILNSKLALFWLYNRGKRKGDTLELFYDPLSKIPIASCSEDQQKMIIALVDEIIVERSKDSRADTHDTEQRVDQLIYEIYGLTDEEISIVESS
ncbi:N-6 DNA methylase [Candidatus Saccharibacteria bacterium]|nr:N-6 DNA methylase [Candidatus Saccharibacteria bacterium]QQS27304.1 MAG: N-6 DNA methylase [bacterium]